MRGPPTAPTSRTRCSARARGTSSGMRGSSQMSKRSGICRSSHRSSGASLRFSRLILFDRRGAGALQDPMPGIQVPPLEVGVTDIIAVMDAVGSRHADLFGSNRWSPFERSPCGRDVSRSRRSTDLVVSERRARSHQRRVPMGSLGPRVGGVDRVARDLVGTAEFTRRWFDEFTPSSARRPRCPRAMGPILPPVREPANDGRDDAGAARFRRDLRVAVGTSTNARSAAHARERELHARSGRVRRGIAIPDARLVVLPGHRRYSRRWVPDLVIEAVEEFLTGHKARKDTDRVLATVLFTDIVDSTEPSRRSR